MCDLIQGFGEVQVYNTTSLPLSILSVMSSINSRSCVIHDFQLINPCWGAEKRLLSVMWSIIAFITSLSINLPGTDVRLIGR